MSGVKPSDFDAELPDNPAEAEAVRDAFKETGGFKREIDFSKPNWAKDIPSPKPAADKKDSSRKDSK